MIGRAGAPVIVASASILAACSDDTLLNPRSDSGVDARPLIPLEAAALDRPPPPPPPPFDYFVPTYCNQAEALCDRRYDQIVFFGTHRSAAVGNPPWKEPTQGRTIAGQLSSGGVRLFELDVRLSGGVLAVCADSCADGSQSLSSVLREFSVFLQGFPQDVLTLLVRSRVPAGELVGAFDSAGLTPLAHTQDPASLWPTLREMAAENHRLVVFLDDSESGTADGGSTPDAGPDAGGRAFFNHHARWIRETAPGVGPECVPSTGSAANPLILVNHYATGPRPTDAGLVTDHDPDSVAARLQRCVEDRGRLPTFLLVDFAEIGDANGGVQIANGLR